MPHSYLSLEELKLRLDVPQDDTSDEATLRRVLEGASRKVDDLCGRRFQPHTATRYYSSDWSDEVEVDDLLTVTSVKTLTANSDGTRTYGDTWATTDYDLEPYDAPDGYEPYTRIARNPAGTYSFPTERRGIEVAGVWGYWLETEASGSVLTAGINTTVTTIPVTSGGDFQRLETILIGSEAMYITAMELNNLTVLRAQHGTTAASHLTSAAVSIYRYPSQVVEATALLAARQYRRTDAPLGIVGSDALGTAQRIASRENDAMFYLSGLRRYHGVGVR